ncbi:hypothetical protein [Kineosporia sp. R_H_3]|uniref:hypothetical protein n=1 Tax=Kineosporia sp. R_H_3 TaxID=1961848 RepID=UPI000B4AD91B|nr:hypothetical protein [Kineosporia sp. R_H_3]
MSIGRFLIIGFLVVSALVYIAVIGMCRAASKADRDQKKPAPPSEDVLLYMDGTVLRGWTPPHGVSGLRGVPTPRYGIPVPSGADAVADEERREGDAG